MDKAIFKSYQSQNKPNTILSPYLCGIACLTMILKYYNQIPSDQDILSIFENYASTGKNNVPYSSITINIKEKNLQVPIIYYPKASSTEDKTKILKDSSQLLKLLNLRHKISDIRINFPIPSNKFIPSFSLWYGFDHRGITPFINKYKYSIKHELIEDKFEIVLKKIKVNTSSTAIISVNPIYIGINIKQPTKKALQVEKRTENITHQDRHDIFLIKVMRYQQQDVVLIADPAHSNYSNGIKLIALKTLKLAYTGHASIFSS